MSKDPFDTSVIQDSNEESKFHLKEFAFKYLAYWRWFIFSMSLCIFLAFIYLKVQTPIYSVRSSILIKDQQKGLGEEDDMMKQLNIFSSNKVVDNEIEVLRSYTLMKEVVDTLKLNITYYRQGFFRKVELYKNSPIKLQVLSATAATYKTPLKVKIINSQTASVNGQTIPFDKIANTPYGLLVLSATGSNPHVKELTVAISTDKKVAEAFTDDIRIEPSSKMSTVLMMTLEDAIPEKGEDILNQLINAYNAAGLADKNLSASNTLAFINERLKIISGELGDAEKQVEDYKSKEGITDISAASQVFLQNVQQNDTQLNQVKLQQSVLADIEKHVSSPPSEQGTIPETLMGIDDPTLLALMGQLSTLELQRQSTIKVVKPGNPMVQAIDSQIASLKNNIYNNIQTLKRGLTVTQQQLERVSNSMNGLIRSVPTKERNLVDISRQQSIKNDLYTFLLKNREETELSFASTVSDTRTVDKAISSDKPIKPNKIIVLLVFCLFGIAIPVAVIYIADLWNDKLKSRTDVEKQTAIPILAEISQTEHVNELVLQLGRSAIAEQIRSLRTNISFLSPGKRLQVIMLTSSISGEGKSFISLNLGASLSIMDKRVIILEFDLRKPKFKEKLKIDFETGLTNYLIGHAELDDIINEVPDYPGYHVITSGLIPPNPVELLVDGRMDELFTILRLRYDYIIVDAPPIGLVTDAQVIEKYTDATFYVLRHQYTPKWRLKYINALYHEGRFKNLNLIMNGIEQNGKYGYGYGYGYGNGYGYYEAAEKVAR